MNELKKASESSIPYAYVSYVRISADNSVHYINAPKSKRNKIDLINLLKESKKTGAKFIAPWEGKYKTDIFEIDDIDAAIKDLESYLI